jgi:hypothetical protein
MKKRFVLVSMVLGVMVTVAACKSQSLEGGAAKEAMGFYAKGYNTLIADFSEDFIEEYFENIPKEGPKDFDNIRLGTEHLRVSRSLSEARQAFERARSAAPESLDDLGTMSSEIMTHVDAILKTYEQAYNYYDAKDFKDDQGKKAKELHQQMLAHAEAYGKVLGKFLTRIDEIEFKQMESEVAAHVDSKDYSYWFRRFNLDAKLFLKKVSRRDAQDISKAFEKIQAVHKNLHGFKDQKASKLNASFKVYVDMTDSFLSSAKRLNRTIAETKPDPQEVEREMDRLVTSYNSVVSLGNTLYELEANGLLE